MGGLGGCQGPSALTLWTLSACFSRADWARPRLPPFSGPNAQAMWGGRTARLLGVLEAGSVWSQLGTGKGLQGLAGQAEEGHCVWDARSHG